VWVVSSLLGLLIAPGSIALWLFAGFFGYYPLIKLRADRMTPLAAWAAKLSAFALAQLGAMTLLAAAFMGYAEKYGKLLTAIAFAVVFVIFDIGYGKLIVIYKTRISKAGKRR
jgi:hypothetical protein